MLLPESLKLHDKSRFEFHYIYFLPWKSQMVEAIEKAGGIVTCMNASSNIQLIFRAARVIKYIREKEIHVVHCHLPWSGFVGRIIHHFLSIPVLYTEHNKQERYHWLTRWLNRITFNKQTAVIAVSADVAASIRDGIRVRIPVTEVVNGVNQDAFVRQVAEGQALRSSLKIPADAIVVGTVAVFRFQKRLKEWIEVFSKLASANDKVYGVIVGQGPLMNELQAYRRALGLEDRLIMPGLQTEVRPWLSAIDIYLMTSVFEGLPVALLEAMSMECAIVATDAGGIKEVIRNEVDGLLTPVNEWRNTFHLVVKLFPEGYRRQLGLAARARVVNNYSMKKMTERLEEMYQSYSDR